MCRVSLALILLTTAYAQSLLRVHVLNPNVLTKLSVIFNSNVLEDTLPSYFVRYIQAEESNAWFPRLNNVVASTFSRELALKYMNASNSILLPQATLLELHQTGDDRMFLSSDGFEMILRHNLGHCDDLGVFVQDQLNDFTFHRYDHILFSTQKRSNEKIILEYNVDKWDQRHELGTRFALYVPPGCNATVVKETQKLSLDFPTFQRLKDRRAFPMVRPSRVFAAEKVRDPILSMQQTEKLFPNVSLDPSATVNYVGFKSRCNHQLPTKGFLSFPAQSKAFFSLSIRFHVVGTDCSAIKLYETLDHEHVKPLMQTSSLHALQTKPGVLDLGFFTKSTDKRRDKFLLYLPKDCDVTVRSIYRLTSLYKRPFRYDTLTPAQRQTDLGIFASV